MTMRNAWGDDSVTGLQDACLDQKTPRARRPLPPGPEWVVCDTDNPIALDVATRRGRKPRSHGDRDHRLGADSVLSWHDPSAVPRQAHVGRLSDSSVGEHAMADDAATVEQLKAELERLRECDAVAQAREAALIDELAEAREQQTATAEILRAIAASPTDLTGVLNSIIQSAAQLTDADYSTIRQSEGSVLRVMASLDPEVIGIVQPVDRGSVNGRVFLDGVTIHEFSPAAEHLA